MNERIKMIRKSLKYTQKEFAKKIGANRTTIVFIEKGTSNPSNLIISSILEKFNVNKEWLEDGVGDMFLDDSNLDLFDKLIEMIDINDIDQLEFIELLSKLNDENRNLLKTLAIKIFDSQKKD